MTLQFNGTLRYRFRISVFGYEIFAGPWQSQDVKISEPVPAVATSIPILDGFTATIGEAGNGVNLGIQWEGIPIVSDTIPVTGSIPISVQPLKGVILAGTAAAVS